MGFSTKVKLFDGKVEQASGLTLTLSGNTIINTGSADLRYSSHPTFVDDEEIVDKKYVDDLAASGSSDLLYSGETPSSVEVGGVDVGTQLTGRTANDILEEMLVPTLNPTLTNPDNTFAHDANALEEIGTSVNLQFTTNFDQGSINPQYTSASDKRSGLPNTYTYTGTGLPSTEASTALSDVQPVNGYTVLAGTNSWTSNVSFSIGVQPKDSKGANFSTPLAAGDINSLPDRTTKTATFLGIYPYFYGKVTVAAGQAGSNRPTINQALIDSGTAVVATVGNPLQVAFNAGVNDYTWFAIPTAYADRIKWEDANNILSNGDVGGTATVDENDLGVNKYPVEETLITDSPDGYWTNAVYKVYLSNAQGIVGTYNFYTA